MISLPWLLSLALAATPVHFAAFSGSPKKAAAAARNAEALWRDGLYDEASAALAEAYELDPQPAYLYARAGVEKDAGRCDNAVAHFEAFLQTDPAEKDAQAARRAMKPCEEKLEEEAAAAAERERLEQEQRDELGSDEMVEITPEQPRDAPVRQDIAGGVLVGLGAAATGAGIGTLVAGLVVHRRARDAATADDFVDDRERGRLLTGVGIGLLAGGVALIVAGAVRYGLLARKRRAARGAHIVPASPTWTGTGLAVRF